jgi:heptosyltransferase II
VSATNRILVVAPAWIGDAVLAQPLLSLLRAGTTPASLDLLATPWTAAVFRRMPEVAQVIVHPFKHGELNLRGRWELGRQLRAKAYQHAIVLPHSFKSALVPAIARIPRRTGYIGEMRYGLLNDARRLDKTALPLMVERFAALATTAGSALPSPLPSPQLKVIAEETTPLREKFKLDPARPIACFCIGAEYGPAKRWPAEYFSHLASLLASRGYAVYLLGSNKDQTLGAVIANTGAAVNLCGQTSLDDAMVLLSMAALVISNDSGLMHVAAALGRPMLALFGSSSPRFTPPLSQRARVLQLDLPCSPCFKRDCPLGHFKCMMDLLPQRVFEESQSLEQID